MLPLTVALLTQIETDCTNFLALVDFIETTRAATQSSTQSKNPCCDGEPEGGPLPAAPLFTNTGALTGTVGLFARLREIGI